MSGGGIRVTRTLTIPEREIHITYSRSGGPGGQHANKASTRAELSWNVSASEVLGPRQRARLLDRLGRRLDSSGVLRLTSDRHRSQLRNRAEVERRLADVVAGALRTPRRRVATAPTTSARERRMRDKRRRSETKKMRRPPLDD